MICVTGASGYLGGRIMEQLDTAGVALPRHDWSLARDRPVIHCAAVVPRTDPEADYRWAAHINIALTIRLIRARPLFVVFPSTLTGDGRYLRSKRLCERLLAAHVPTAVIRFPGLYGPPRRSGLVYNLFRALARGESFIPDRPLADWTGLHVDEAAAECVTTIHEFSPEYGYGLASWRKGGPAYTWDCVDENLNALIRWANENEEAS